MDNKLPGTRETLPENSSEQLTSISPEIDSSREVLTESPQKPAIDDQNQDNNQNVAVSTQPEEKIENVVDKRDSEEETQSLQNSPQKLTREADEEEEDFIEHVEEIHSLV